MIKRYAIFNGTVKPGLEQEMRDYVNTKLAPLWRKFACAKQVEILFAQQQDPNGPTIPLILAITYENRDDIAAALDSPARYESRDMLPAFYERFFDDVVLHHYEFEPLA